MKLSNLFAAGLLAWATAACSSDGDTPRDVPTESDDDAVEGDDDEAAPNEGKRDAGASGGEGKVDASKPRGEGTPDASVSKIDAAGRDSATAKPDAGSAQGSGDASSGTDAGAVDQEPEEACKPADKKPDPMNVPLSSIRRYAGMTIAPAKGPLKPVIESDPGFPDWTVYRPEKLGDGRKNPIMVWANGGCSRDGTYFSKFLLEVASYGIVAIADGKPNGSGMRSLGPDGAPQKSALDWIIAENDRPCSQYYRKLDVTKTAAMGQSCGGLMTLGASSDKRLTTVGIFNSGLFEKDQKIFDGLHTPVGYFIGGESDIAYAQAEGDVELITKVPLFYGNLDVGHFATWAQDNAGEFGRVGAAWLRWHLLEDPEAKKIFSGADCELCKPPSKWVVEKKMME